MTNPTEAPMANAIDDVKEWAPVAFRWTYSIEEGGRILGPFYGSIAPDLNEYPNSVVMPLFATPSPSQHTGWSDEAVEALAISVFDQTSDNYTVPWDKQPGRVRSQTRKHVRQVLTALRIHQTSALTAASSIAPATGFEVKARGYYVASKVAHAEMWKDFRLFEREPIISTWIDEAGAGESASLQDLWRRCVHEASTAGALIIYRRPDEVLKGAWVELGAALACGVPVFAVGIEEFTVANHAGITHCENLIEARKLARAAVRSSISPSVAKESGEP